MDKQLNTVQYAQVEHVLKKIAKDNGIENVKGVVVELTPDACSVKFATEDTPEKKDKAESEVPKEESADDEKGTFESIGDIGGGIALDVLAPEAAFIPGVSDMASAAGGNMGKILDEDGLIDGAKKIIEQNPLIGGNPLTGGMGPIPGVPLGGLKGIFAADDPDFSKFSSLDDLHKYALDAYSAGKGISDAASSAWDTVTSPIKSVGNAISSGIDSIGDGAKNFWNGLTGGDQNPQPEAQPSTSNAMNDSMYQEMGTVNQGNPGDPTVAENAGEAPQQPINNVTPPANNQSMDQQSNQLGGQQGANTPAADQQAGPSGLDPSQNTFNLTAVDPANPTQGMQQNDSTVMSQFQTLLDQAEQSTDINGNMKYNPDIYNALQNMVQQTESAKQNGLVSPDFDANYYIESYTSKLPQV